MRYNILLNIFYQIYYFPKGCVTRNAQHVYFSVPSTLMISKLFYIANLIGENYCFCFSCCFLKSQLQVKILFKTSHSRSSINVLNMLFVDLSIRILVIFLSIYLNSLETILFPSFLFAFLNFNFQNYGCSYVVKFLFFSIVFKLRNSYFPRGLRNI